MASQRNCNKNYFELCFLLIVGCAEKPAFKCASDVISVSAFGEFIESYLK